MQRYWIPENKNSKGTHCGNSLLAFEALQFSAVLCVVDTFLAYLVLWGCFEIFWNFPVFFENPAVFDEKPAVFSNFRHFDHFLSRPKFTKIGYPRFCGRIEELSRRSTTHFWRWVSVSHTISLYLATFLWLHPNRHPPPHPRTLQIVENPDASRCAARERCTLGSLRSPPLRGQLLRLGGSTFLKVQHNKHRQLYKYKSVRSRRTYARTRRPSKTPPVILVELTSRRSNCRKCVPSTHF